MGKANKEEECNETPPPVGTTLPSDSTLGIYTANGKAVYAQDGTVSLVLVDAELKKIWQEEAESRGVLFKTFKAELEELARPLLFDATRVTLPAQDQIATLPGNVRLRHLRLCLCWRWICIYVWVRI
jgi:hypothetical protein